MPGLYEKEDYIYNQIPVRILIHDLHQEEIYTPLHWHLGSGTKPGYRRADQYVDRWYK